MNPPPDPRRRRPPEPLSPHAERWEERYASRDTPWTLPGPPPALLDLLERLVDSSLRVLVPGAGHGHDALAWAAAGHDVTAVDHAPTAVEEARRRGRRAGLRLRVLLVDVLDLPRDLEGEFDAIWEQTCFCAIPPEHRRAYAGQMAKALRPGGRLYGLFWDHGQPGGPPYRVTEACVRAVFERTFEILEARPVVSHPRRGPEFLTVMRRRSWRPRAWKR